jgi:hypothetical protein
VDDDVANCVFDGLYSLGYLNVRQGLVPSRGKVCLFRK